MREPRKSPIHKVIGKRVAAARKLLVIVDHADCQRCSLRTDRIPHFDRNAHTLKE
jgi:hypothetical protein